MTEGRNTRNSHANAVFIGNTLDTSLLMGGARRSCSGAVAVINTLNTLLFSERAGSETGTSTVGIGFANNGSVEFRSGANVTGISVTESPDRFLGSSPLRNRAVRTLCALNAATTFKLTVRETGIGTVSVFRTEVYTDTSKDIAVVVGSGSSRRTVGTSSTGITREAAIVTEAITATVGSYSRAVSIRLARSTSSGSAITSRLTRDSSTIKCIAERIAYTSSARTINIAVVVILTSKGGLTTSIVDSVGRGSSTVEWINANTVVSANSVFPECVGRSIKSRTLCVIRTSHASAIGITVGCVCWARGVTIGSTKVVSAGTDANSRVSITNNLLRSFSTISTPGISRGNTVGIVTAGETETIGHAVSSLGAYTSSVGGTGINTNSG